jgi:hypothetical protein
MIVNREKAILPNFQKYAAAKKIMSELSPLMEAAQKLVTNAEYNKNLFTSQIYTRIPYIAIATPEEASTLLEQQKNDIDKLSTITMEYTNARVQLTRVSSQFLVQDNIYNNVDSKKEVEKKEFIMKCVKDGCRGFLSQAYKCELCSTYVCKECMIPKSEKNDDAHVCKKDDVDTVTLIRKETRPCPKCGIRISKIDGCDQMWCTAADCGTAFSWINGKVISGVIHNPHYYEWIRRTNGEVPRNPGEILCGGLPTYYNAISIPLRTLGLTYKTLYKAQIDTITQIHTCLSDLEYVRVPQYNVRRHVDMLKEVHVDFLLGNIDEDKWSQSIYLKENNCEKKQMIGQIVQTFYNAGADMMRNLTTILADMQRKKILNPKFVANDEEMKPLFEMIVEFEKLRAYINESFEKLGKSVSCAVPQFDDTWRWQQPASVVRIKASKNVVVSK